MRFGKIYKLSYGDKFIVGSTIEFNKRITQHFCDLSAKRHGNRYLQNLFNKYGRFPSVEILQENIPEDLLRYTEDIWIGSKCSKIQDKRNGLNITDGSRVNSDCLVKYKKDRKIGYKRGTDWNNKQCKPVIQKTLDGNIIKIWASAFQAEKQSGFNSASISRVCKNRYGCKTYKNFLWSFYDKDVENIARINAKNKAKQAAKKK